MPTVCKAYFTGIGVLSIGVPGAVVHNLALLTGPYHILGELCQGPPSIAGGPLYAKTTQAWP